MAVNNKQTRSVPHELTHFDSLPDSAYVRLPVVVGLYACSTATVWRGVKKGNIPQPIKLSPNISAWNVGVLRRALAEKS